MNSEYVVRVDRVILDTDMRRTKSLAYDYPHIYRNMRRGHVIMFLNRTGKMARFIDCAKGIHTFYADKGETFRVDTIVDLCNARLLEIGLKVTTGRRVRSGRATGISVKAA